MSSKKTRPGKKQKEIVYRRKARKPTPPANQTPAHRRDFIVALRMVLNALLKALVVGHHFVLAKIALRALFVLLVLVLQTCSS